MPTKSRLQQFTDLETIFLGECTYQTPGRSDQNDSGSRFYVNAYVLRDLAGDGNDAYVVVEASVPGSQTSTGTTYGTIDPGAGSQGSIYFSKTTDGGATWSPPMRIDPQATGHQFYPDIDIDNGVLYAVYHDSRNDDWRVK